ncbi:hypothetical protein DYBT9275_05780 [Dyadobacter sp. CECT 9275]|uniref:PhnB-like domain-containing protein n=1 Tax=Dyadobacter helix TaxID=2822344 RepID=A0A916NEL9_9BACT|nr:VOC family protein [Dyadobacter sp. CECT 9275]CAG5017475.1 hypothetical protein DYBT9275_05780 [Dyadobacter sp. CECT 9275]
MTTINPYLNFSGNTEEAFNFYKSVFGGEFTMVQRFGEGAPGQETPIEDRDKIMHISLPIGSGNMIMGTDATESMGFKLTVGNNVYICVSPDSREEADRLFSGLSEGGFIEMELQDMFWGAYYGSFKDKFGIQWMINYVDSSRFAE